MFAPPLRVWRRRDCVALRDRVSFLLRLGVGGARGLAGASVDGSVRRPGEGGQRGRGRSQRARSRVCVGGAKRGEREQRVLLLSPDKPLPESRPREAFTPAQGAMRARDDVEHPPEASNLRCARRLTWPGWTFPKAARIGATTRRPPLHVRLTAAARLTPGKGAARERRVRAAGPPAWRVAIACILARRGRRRKGGPRVCVCVCWEALSRSLAARARSVCVFVCLSN